MRNLWVKKLHRLLSPFRYLVSLLLTIWHSESPNPHICNKNTVKTSKASGWKTQPCSACLGWSLLPVIAYLRNLPKLFNIPIYTGPVAVCMYKGQCVQTQTHHPHPLLVQYNQSFSPGFAFVPRFLPPALCPFLHTLYSWGVTQYRAVLWSLWLWRYLCKQGCWFHYAAAVPRYWDISAAMALLFHLRYFILEKRKCYFTICVVKRAHLCDETDSELGWYCFIDARRNIREYINTITLKVIARQQKCHFMSNLFCFSVLISLQLPLESSPQNLIVH